MTPRARYERIGTIARSRRAEIQLALRRDGAEERVAIKTTREDAPSSARGSLRNEATVLRWIKHPGVVAFRDFGQVGSRDYLVTEYLDGVPLVELIRAGKAGSRLDSLSTARLIARTAEVLRAVHELTDATGRTPLDLVHHDVSLSNVMVLYDGRMKIIDFGLARAGSSAVVSEVEGTLSCMAPEKLRGAAGDRRSDLFSLGCVAWQALTLEPLFRGLDDNDTATRVLTIPVRAPSEVNRGVPRELDAVVMRMLERDPDKRSASAGQVADEIETILRSRSYPENNALIATYMTETFGKFREERERFIAAACAATI